MLYLDLKKAQDLVAEAVAEKGEGYVYEKEGYSCLYVHGIDSVWNPETEEYEKSFDDATPGCIVGNALKRGGVPIEALGTGMHNDSDVSSLLNFLQKKEFVTFSDTAKSYLYNVQSSQDLGVPWGIAAEAAARGKTMDIRYDENGQPTGEYFENDGASLYL